jgi:zinc transport system substrate-binding protein
MNRPEMIGPGLRSLGALALLVLPILCVSCRREVPAPAPSGVRVVVSIPPQAYFVERIGGDRVHVETLVARGESPHDFEPTLKQMARLGEASVYFRIGIPFEARLCEKLSSTHSNLRLVDTSAGIEPRSAGHEETSGHDDHGDHDEIDPHTWMSPKLAMLQARAIAKTLCELDADGAETYRANLASLLADLEQVNARISAALAPLEGKPLYVFHPAFGHFAEAYGLRQVAVETGGKAPSLKHVHELVTRAKEDGVRVIFVQPQFSRTTAETIAREIGGAVVAIDPLSRDYLANLSHLADQVARALAGADPTDEGSR